MTCQFVKIYLLMSPEQPKTNRSAAAPFQACSSWPQADLGGSDLSKSDLTGASLEGANLEDVSFENVPTLEVTGRPHANLMAS